MIASSKTYFFKIIVKILISILEIRRYTPISRPFEFKRQRVSLVGYVRYATELCFNCDQEEDSGLLKPG